MPILLELERGIGEPEQVPLSVGKVLSVGRRGMWRIDGPKVLDIHGYFFYDGVALFVMSETDGNPVLVNRHETPPTWTLVRSPAEISMGGVVLKFVGTLGQEDSGVTLARVPPPAREEMSLEDEPTSGGGQTLPREQPAPPPPERPSAPRGGGSQAPRPRAPSIAPIKQPSAAPPPPRKPEYVEAPRHDLDGTSGVTHVRPETLERLNADFEEAQQPKTKPQRPEGPVVAQPPSGGHTVVLPEGATHPPDRMSAPPQAQGAPAGEGRKKEESGQTRFAPLEAPSGPALDGSQDVRAQQLSGAHFQSGPPALYAHQTGPAFAPPPGGWPGPQGPMPAPGMPGAIPMPGASPGSPPQINPKEATVQNLSFGARVKRDWKATSWPRKALLFLAPALAWVLLSDDPDDAPPGKTAGTASAKPTATASASAPGTQTIPISTGAPATTLAVIPAPLPTATGTGKTAPLIASAAGTASKVPPTVERKAIDALALGQETEAIKFYEQLDSEQQGQNPNIKEAIRILKKKQQPK